MVNVLGLAVEVQDQLMRLAKLLPAAEHCPEEHDRMVADLTRLRQSLMEFETLADLVLSQSVPREPL